MRLIDQPEYRCWCAMRRRCLRPHDAAYKYYGARGITICDRWMVYENFLKDMGKRPVGKSIDRINNDGNYEPGNCRWATQLQQNQNSRSVKHITFRGETKTMREWSRDFGLCQATVSDRLIRGWSIEDSLTKPLIPNSSRSKHGHARSGKTTKTYYVWKSIKDRCYCVADPSYKHYGGRGIYVYDKWKNDFGQFLTDMGEQPAGERLDRIDPNGPYSPENCRWSAKAGRRKK